MKEEEEGEEERREAKREDVPTDETTDKTQGSSREKNKNYAPLDASPMPLLRLAPPTARIERGECE